MRVPQWLKTSLMGAALAVVGWSITDRIHLGERIATIEQYIKDSITRLDRIEHKVDELRVKGQ